MTSGWLQPIILLGVPATCVASGLFVLFKNPSSAAGRNFLYFNIALAVWNLGDFFVLFFREYETLVLPVYRISSIGGVFFVAFLIRFHCAVVGEVEPSRRIRWFLSVMTPVLAILTLSPLVIRDIKYSEDGFSEVPGPANSVLGVYLLWGILYGLIRLIVYYRRADPAKRVQIQYILSAFGFVCLGVISYVAGSTLVPSGDVPVYLTYYLTEIGYNFLMAYAVLQHGALDIKTAIHKTALWAASSAAVVVPAVGVYWAGFPLVKENRVLGAALVAVVGFGLLMYARLVQPAIDHRFQRRRYDLYRTIQALAEDLVVLKSSVDEVSEKVVQTVDRVLYPSTAFVVVFAAGAPRSVYPATRAVPGHGEAVYAWLARRNDLISRKACATDRGLVDIAADAAVYLESTQSEVVVPFVKDGELLGVLHLGAKRTLQAFTALDLDFLNRLRTEVTVAYHNAILYENMTALSKQLEGWNAELEAKIQRRTQELEGAYNQLKELDTAKTQFFATISHELRTPLTLILAPLESLVKGELGPVSDDVRRYADVMYANGLRLLKQINNLLDLTKLDAGGMTLRYEPGGLGEFFRGLIASVAPMAEKKGISFEAQEGGPLPRRSYFDRDRLEKIVLNLIFNALKFTPEGGRVAVRWGLSELGDVEIEVTDTGIGIAPVDVPKLFKRFSQIDSATTRRYEGTGIGLALVKELAELHGGRVSVASEPGAGSTFTVTIPVVLEDPNGSGTGIDDASASEREAPDMPSDWTRELRVAADRHQAESNGTSVLSEGKTLSPANGRQILVVEDNPDMREFVAFQLQGEYRVLRAANGREGLRIAAEAVPDVIVSDVMMPEMDGYQLCRAIREHERTRHIPIVLLTARAELALKIEGLEHGADDYLTKPFNAQELRAKIKSLLELRRLEREIQQRNEALEAAIKELQATQAQLVQSEKMAGLGMLVAGMAHEINNPVSFAKNSLSLVTKMWREVRPRLSDGGADAEAVGDIDASLAIVQNGLERTQQIVAQLKTFVRKDQGQKIECSVREGLESTLGLLRAALTGGIAVHVDLQSTRPVNAVPGKLNQVWMNLLQNAVHAVGATGEIWVESHDHEHMVTVTIRDSGPGITPEVMPRLFEPFFTTKPVGQGTGLGLSVSYQIVQDAGGRIEVRSEPGRGAEFTVVLPSAQGLARAA